MTFTSFGNSLAAILVLLSCWTSSLSAQHPKSLEEATESLLKEGSEETTKILGIVMEAMGGEKAYLASANARIVGVRTIFSEVPELNLTEAWGFWSSDDGSRKMQSRIHGHTQTLVYAGKNAWIKYSTGKVQKLDSLSKRILDLESNQQDLLLNYAKKGYVARRLKSSDSPASKDHVLEFRHKDQAASFVLETTPKKKTVHGPAKLYVVIDDQELADIDVEKSVAGSVYRYYFNKETLLLSRVEFLNLDRWSGKNYWLLVQFSDYRIASGYQFPFRSTYYRDLKKLSESVVRTAELGRAVGIEEFVKPSED